MEENLNSVNAETVEVVTPQDTEQVETVETVNAVEGEATTTKQDTKPVQTQEENATYAKIRREAEAKAEAKARDSVISEMYGASHGIHTYADYQKAVQEQEMKDKGVDPDSVKQYAEELPEVKEARQLKRDREQFIEFAKEFPGVEPKDIPSEVLTEYAKGKPLVDAYALYEIRQTRAAKAAAEAKAAEEAAKAKANETNAASSMGSVGSNGNTDTGFISSDEFEKNRGNQEWVNKNYKKIMDSRAKW